MSNLNEERLRKFREMGIPTPMAPVDPATAKGPVRNLEFAAKLEAIKRGVVKEEISTFIEKQGPAKGFVPLENPLKNKKVVNEATVEPIKKPPVSGPSFDAYEKALYGDSPSVSFDKSANTGRGYSADINNHSDDTGSDFLADIRARLAEKAMRSNPNTSSNNAQKLLNENKNTIPPGHTVINQNDLKEAITLISTDVCKSLMKEFMSEFLASESGVIRESDRVKRAEIIRENIIKIEGSYFKITPVTIKKK